MHFDALQDRSSKFIATKGPIGFLSGYIEDIIGLFAGSSDTHSIDRASFPRRSNQDSKNIASSKTPSRSSLFQMFPIRNDYSETDNARLWARLALSRQNGFCSWTAHLSFIYVQESQTSAPLWLLSYYLI